MKITEEAKSLIMEVLVSNDCDCLQATLQQSCCGTSLNFTLKKLRAGEDHISINGISVIMDNKTLERAETATLAAKDGEIIIQDGEQSCCS